MRAVSEDLGLCLGPSARDRRTMRHWGTAPRRQRLAEGEVQVFRASLDSPSVPAPELLPLLSEVERVRARRFCFEHDRDRFVAGRGTLRLLLGAYLAEEPERLVFAYGPRGKPSLKDAADVRFNVSHSAGLALLAFAWGVDVGVDLERERPVPEAAEIAARLF